MRTLKWNLIFFVILLIGSANQGWAAGPDYMVTPRHERLAIKYLETHPGVSAPLPGMAFEVLPKDVQKKIDLQIREEVITKVERDSLLDNQSSEGVADLTDKSALSKIRKNMIRIYQSGLQAEGYDSSTIKEMLATYSNQLTNLALKVPLEKLQNPWEQTRLLAQAYGYSFLSAQEASRQGDIRQARDQSAIALRMMTEAYLQAGLNLGDRQTALRKVFSLYANLSIPTLGWVALFANFNPHLSVLGNTAIFTGAVLSFLLPVSAVINDERYRQVKYGAEGIKPFMFPDRLAMKLSQKKFTNQLVDYFWESVQSFVSREKPELKLVGGFNDNLLEFSQLKSTSELVRKYSEEGLRLRNCQLLLE